MGDGTHGVERDPRAGGTNPVTIARQASGHDVDLVPGGSEGFGDFGGS